MARPEKSVFAREDDHATDEVTMYRAFVAIGVIIDLLMVVLVGLCVIGFVVFTPKE